MTIALLIAALVVAVVDWVAVARNNAPTEYVAKPAVMVLLILAVVALDDFSALHGWVIAGLALSLVGDIVLMLPNGQFEAGLGAFLLAHVAYIVAFGEVGQSAAWFVAGLALAAIGVVAVGRRIIRAAATADGQVLALAVSAYVTVIAVMGVRGFSTGSALVAGAATLFMVSDALLGWGRFVAPLPGDRTLVHATYHLAQAGFVLWLVQLAP